MRTTIVRCSYLVAFLALALLSGCKSQDVQKANTVLTALCESKGQLIPVVVPESKATLTLEQAEKACGAKDAVLTAVTSETK